MLLDELLRLGASGGLVFALGVGYLVRFFSSVAIPNFLPGAGEAILFLVAATVAIGAASGKLMTMVSSARVASLPEESLRDSMVRIRERARAPRFVALAGGTGLAALLRGLKEQTMLTGIVTVADDGGSVFRDGRRPCHRLRATRRDIGRRYAPAIGVGIDAGGTGRRRG